MPTYLNSSNMDVMLGQSMSQDPFTSLPGREIPTSQSLANIINAPSAEATEYHTQFTHVWINTQDLRIKFDLRQEYRLDTLHFWNYHTEEYDVDEIRLTFRDAENNLLGRQTYRPDIGVGLNQEAQDIALNVDFDINNVQYVIAVLSGQNGEVDFNNMGFTGEASCDSVVTGTAKSDLYLACENAVAYDLLGQQTVQTTHLDDAVGDIVDYSRSFSRVVVDLAGGTGKSGYAEGDSYLNVESVNGSAFNDRLLGNSEKNFFEGGKGADFFNGRGGADGVRFDGSSTGVRVDLETGIGKGGDAEGDRFRSIEIAFGSEFDDTLFGDGKNNSLSGLGGNDTIIGGAGKDSMSGGTGFDTLSYKASNAGVRIDLAKEKASGGDAAGDIFSGFESVIGSSRGDTLRGDSGQNTLNGRGGVDKLVGGQGRDILIGGAGGDTFVFGRGHSISGGDQDVIRDFGFGNDKIDLQVFGFSGIDDLVLIESLGDVLVRSAADAGNTLSIRLKDLTAAQLFESDFIF